MLAPLIAFAIASPPLVMRAQRHDVSPALRSIAPRPAIIRPEHDEPEVVLRSPLSRLAFDPLLQVAAFAAAPGALLSFDGIGARTAAVNANPPDANGAIGPHHLLQVTNFWFAVWSRAGELLYGPAGATTTWQGFEGLCGSTDAGDPVALYDRLADRWLMMHMAWDFGTMTGAECVAVSAGADPMGMWYRYQFSFSSTNDAGKIGLWPDAYVFTTMLTTNDGLARACAFDRARMLAGQDATQQCFVLPAGESQPIPADLDGSNPPPAGEAAWLVASDVDSLGIFRLHVDWLEPSASWLSDRLAVAVAPWNTPNCAECVPQPGTTQRLIAGSGFLQHRIPYRNFGDHEALVLNYPIDAGNGIVGIRWYELRPDSGGGAALFQQGTFAPDATHRFKGAAAMDKNGNLAVAYSVSSETTYPSIRYAARLAGDPPGLLTLGEANLYEGTASQTWSARWGDYSSLQTDPADDCTFWHTNEYAGDGAPATRIVTFRLPGCAAADDFAVSVAPAFQAVQGGSAAAYEVTTRIVSGSAEPLRLSVSGLPPGTAGSFTPAGLMSGTGATLVVSAAADAAAAPSTAFTVEASDGFASHGAIAQIQVLAPSAPDAARAGDGATDAGFPDGAVQDAADAAAGAGDAGAQLTNPQAGPAASGCGCGSNTDSVDGVALALLATYAARGRARRR